MRASRSPIGRMLAVGAILSLITAAGIAAGTLNASALPLPPQRPCGEKTCEHTATSERFAFDVSRSRWSIAAVQGVPGASYLNLWDPSGSNIKASHGDDNTTWIAMDNTPGRHPTGTYRLGINLTLHPGAPAEHWIQFINGRGDLLKQGQTTIGDPNGTWIADIRDARLQAGDTLSLTTHGGEIAEIRVLSSVATQPSSWLQTQDTNVAATFYVPKADTPDDVHTFDFTAPTSGTYGLVFLPFGWWSRSSIVTAGI